MQRSGDQIKGGSALLQGHTNNPAKVYYSRPITVECIDFSARITANFNRDDYIVIKMDAEGAEYEIFDKMIADGSINYVNELIIEFHWMMNENITKERHNSLMRTLKKLMQVKELPH